MTFSLESERTDRGSLITRGAIFADPDERQHRLLLSRTWGSEIARVLFVGLNPSTADARRDDPTVTRLIGFARRWGFDGFDLVNLIPRCSPHPRDAEAWLMGRGPDVARLMARNDAMIADMAGSARRVVACWGVVPWAVDLIEDACAAIMRVRADGAIYCMGRTANQSPIHPMARGRHRVPHTATCSIWRTKGGIKDA